MCVVCALKTWSVKYYNAVADIKKEVELALKENPNAVVIVMSDHGLCMLGNTRKDYEGKLETENRADREMFFRDKCGAFMAVRGGG
jgi:rhamnose utilization protein RhaD (predicted bifunctional aldolase and dehydrogenase)